MAARMIALAGGDMRLDLDPQMGGSLTRLTFRGLDVLRPALPDRQGPLETACFPLVPFANRIADGVVLGQGRRIVLPPNFGAHPHPLHGHGWLQPWRTVLCEAARATLAFDHAADDWPWAYSARQDIRLGDGGLDLELSATNLDPRPMPVSLGFHPYFNRTPETRLETRVSGVWLSDASLIPTDHATRSPLLDVLDDGGLSATPDLDHCFSGWSGAFSIRQAGLTIRITGSEALRFLHVYTPPSEPWFCAEPVSAMPDALNRPEPAEATGHRVLQPGETCSVAIRLTVAAPL